MIHIFAFLIIARKVELRKIFTILRYFTLNFTVNVDEFLQEAETLSVQDMPRSASSLSVRTDASGAAVSIISAVKHDSLTTHENSSFFFFFIFYVERSILYAEECNREFPRQSKPMKR